VTTAMGVKATGEPERDLWQTPSYILFAIRSFFPRMFDPCPSGYTLDAFREDAPLLEGLQLYINPPFSQYLKWAKHFAPMPHEQIWMMHHTHDSQWSRLLWDRASAACLLKKRVHFINPETGQRSQRTAYGKCQTLLYIGERNSAFQKAFRELGRIVLTV